MMRGEYPVIQSNTVILIFYIASGIPSLKERTDHPRS